MKKSIYCWLICVLGLTSHVYAQHVFYRSYVPYTSLSVFQYLSLPKEYTLSQKHREDNISFSEHFINWTELNYFAVALQETTFTQKDNFIVNPWLVANNDGKQLRALVYQDLLSITVDSELTLKRLVLLNADFRSLLFERLYDPLFVNSVSYNHTNLQLYSLLPFTGDNGLIDLFVKSRYYGKDIDMTSVKSPYIANTYKKLLIEARGLNLKPALFPKIYSYDENNKLILVYSFSMANKYNIIQKGYAHYIKDEKSYVKPEQKNFYTAGIESYGEAKTDIIISRESFLKFFASEEAKQNLKNGEFYIVIGDELDPK